jgi:3-isopropylmalate/(R)-2-methylmalate dehydratase small subunit
MAQPFRPLTAIAAPLPRANVDTEVIIPIGRLISHRRGTLGPFCFEPWRYLPDGSPDPQFALNEPRYAGARILLGGANFGCGSSREAAVWALWDLGIRCVIAESFGDIFRANCFQNGLLPVTLDAATLAWLTTWAGARRPPLLGVDLQHSRLLAAGRSIPFVIDPERRTALLEGLDDIGLTLKSLADIRTFIRRDLGTRPWAQSAGGG